MCRDSRIGGNEEYLKQIAFWGISERIPAETSWSQVLVYCQAYGWYYIIHADLSSSSSLRETSSLYLTKLDQVGACNYAYMESNFLALDMDFMSPSR